jgi:tetratricopeptide (TPR) repeat protein
MVTLFYLPFLEDLDQDDVDAVLPLGLPLIIREPYLTDPAEGNVAYIRVESPSDVIFPRPGEAILNGDWKYPLPQTLVKSRSSPLEWKDLGNRLYQKQHFFSAVVAYTKGIVPGADSSILLANRAQAYLKLGWYLAALTDARAVMSSVDASSELHRKSKFRAGLAEYHREQYADALRYFEDLSASGKGDTQCREWIQKTKSRLLEVSGDYDWVRIFRTCQHAQEAVDIADFVGPVRASKLPADEGGRGMVTTRDVKAGDLLVSCILFKPFFSQGLILNRPTTSPFT